MNNKQDCITTKELKALLELHTDDVVIADVRSADEYAAQHINGAVHFPLTELENRVHELLKSKTIITV